MAIAEFELGLELDSAGESIPEIFLVFGAVRSSRTTARCSPRPRDAPSDWRNKGGSHEPDPSAGVFFSWRGLGVDLAGPLTAVSLYYRVPRDSVL